MKETRVYHARFARNWSSFSNRNLYENDRIHWFPLSRIFSSFFLLQINNMSAEVESSFVALHSGCM